MKAPKVLLIFGLFLPVLILLFSCEKGSEIREDPHNWIVMGEEEGMDVQHFYPPLELFDVYDTLLILPEEGGYKHINFYIHYSGPTGCRNYVSEVMLGSSDSIRFLYHEEEHMAYYHEVWHEKYYPADPPDHDNEWVYIFEQTTDFVESDSPEGMLKMEVLKPFALGDTAWMGDYFREGGSLEYFIDSRLAYSFGPEPWNACRFEPDSSFFSGDTTFLYFTNKGNRYDYNKALYDPEGVYICFSLGNGGRQRLGWLNLVTSGQNVSVSACAIQH